MNIKIFIVYVSVWINENAIKPAIENILVR